MMKRDDWAKWHEHQNSLMTTLNTQRQQFIEHFKIWVSWHIKLVGENQNVAYNEFFEMQAGINVKQRTLTKPPQPSQ